MQHQVLVATREPTGGVLSLPFPLLLSVSRYLRKGGAALLPQPLPGLSSNWGREELLGTASGPQHSDLLFEQPSV